MDKFELLQDMLHEPNGQVRLLGAILILGTVFSGAMGITAEPALLSVGFGSGVLLVLASIYMAVVKAKLKAANPERRSSRDKFRATPRLISFANDVLVTPRTRHQVMEQKFQRYTDMEVEQLYELLMQATLRECVLCGLVRCEDGIYSLVEEDNTTFTQRDEA